MNINTILIYFMSISNISLFASLPADQQSKPSEEITYCIKENQRPDTAHWVIFPITYDYDTRAEKTSGKENVQISFPIMPQQNVNPLEGENLLSTFSAIDKDGMVFKIAAMQIPEEGFDVPQSLDALIDQLQKQPENKITAYAPSQDPDHSAFTISWVNDNEMIVLKVIKRTHFVYFLETVASNEIYRDIESIEINSPEMDVWMKDSLKSGVFFHSFNTTDAANLK